MTSDELHLGIRLCFYYMVECLSMITKICINLLEFVQSDSKSDWIGGFTMGKSNLKTWLAENDVTLKELAAATKLDYRNLSRIVNGQRPSISTAEKIAKFTGESVWDLWPNVFKYERLFRRRTKSG